MAGLSSAQSTHQQNAPTALATAPTSSSSIMTLMERTGARGVALPGLRAVPLLSGIRLSVNPPLAFAEGCARAYPVVWCSGVRGVARGDLALRTDVGLRADVGFVLLDSAERFLSRAVPGVVVAAGAGVLDPMDDSAGRRADVGLAGLPSSAGRAGVLNPVGTAGAGVFSVAVARARSGVLVAAALALPRAGFARAGLPSLVVVVVRRVVAVLFSSCRIVV